MQTPSPLLPALLLALMLTACGEKSGKPAASQVAAKVGSSEVSVHQINQVLSRNNSTGVAPEMAQAISKEALEKLIDQQLAVDQAVEAKLHRAPEVVSQLEAARLEILARAYLKRVANEATKPTPQEANKYFDDHPYLFAQRRIFNIQEIVISSAASDSGTIDQLRAFADSGKPIEEAATWLKAQKIKFSGGSATRAAEQIPLDLLPKIHTLKDGQSALLEAPKSLTLLRVASSQNAPVSKSDALPRIEQFLENRKTTATVENHIKQLRSNTKIEYVGEFANNALEKGVAGLR